MQCTPKKGIHSMKPTDPLFWKQELTELKEKTNAFYAGELDKAAYKGFSGFYGSYAQRGGTSSMLRLRMTAGRVTKEKLTFTADSIRKYQISRIHFTTCQTIQLHDLSPEAVFEIAESALDCGIITMGGGGDYPRNVMCSPLSGVEQGEYFDTLPYAEAAAEYLMTFLKEEKLPRKLKVGFSNSPENLTHATYRDLGFAARPDKTFDVYSAGGLGNNPKFGIKVAEKVPPEKILYYVKAMRLVFCAFGNYANRGRARTRYIPETLGGPENYKKAFQEKLREVMASGEDLDLTVCPPHFNKKGNGFAVSGSRIIPQKQDGLCTVLWHPLGGQPDPEVFCSLCGLISGMDEAELRLSPDQTAYIINLNGDEARQVLEATKGGAETPFEASVSCIGAGICQIGVRDSQALLSACIDAVRRANLPDNALPKIHISGCPSSCGTHQTGAIGFRGGVKLIGKKPVPAFVLYVNGESSQGKETMGRELGIIPETEIPAFLTALGKTVAASGLPFSAWNQKDPKALEHIAASYIH